MWHGFCPHRKQFLITLGRVVSFSTNLREGTEQLRFCSVSSVLRKSGIFCGKASSQAKAREQPSMAKEIIFPLNPHC